MNILEHILIKGALEKLLIKMTETQKYHLMFKEKEIQEAIEMNHYVEFLYNGQIQNFEQAFEKLVSTQPMLKARILDKENFKIEENIECTIPYTQIHSYNSSLIKQKRKEIFQKKYSMKNYPRFTIEAFEEKNGIRILFNIDSLIIDTLGISQLVNQLQDILTNPMESVKDYSNDLLEMNQLYHERKSDESYKKSKKYYVNNLENIYLGPQINYQNEQKKSEKFSYKERIIDENLYKLLKIKADQLSVSVDSILLASYSLILSKWSKENNYSISLFDTYNPKGKNHYKVLGNFTSSFLLQISFEFKKSFEENIRKVELSLQNRSAFFDFEIPELIQEMDKKTFSEISPISFTSLALTEDSNVLSNVLNTRYYQSIHLQMYLDFQVKKIGEELSILWNYRKDKFDSTIIDAMFSEYYSVIFDFLQSEAEVLDTYNFSKNHQLILQYENYNFQTAATDFNFNTLKEHFKDTVEKYPEKVFAIFSDEKYTFSQLFELAIEKADEIQKIKKEYKKSKVRIAFNGEKNLHSIVCIFASIITNDSFCVINESFGEEKSEEILSSIENYIYFNNGQLAEVSVQNTHVDKDEAYVIHTSGTTGQPKGIIITEKAALNTVYDILEKFKITQEDTVMNISNLYFDLSIFDIFGAAVSGMSIVFVDAYENTWIFNNDYYKKISIWNSTPALAKEFLIKNKFEKLKGVLVSGDFVPKQTIDELFLMYGNIQIYALGGATEASIWSNYYDCSSYHDVSTIPYGLPLANQKLYIVNSKDELCDFRVLGEICIAGQGLAEGYLSKKQTDASFVWNNTLKKKVYKTGDLGYLGTDNLIYIVGRVTSEIKHNGYRIDLREIEKYLNLQENISSSVAFIEKMQNGRTRLICAVVGTKSSNIKRQIRTELSKKLPLYMIPNRILTVSKIPLTKNGKVDTKTLSKML